MFQAKRDTFYFFAIGSFVCAVIASTPFSPAYDISSLFVIFPILIILLWASRFLFSLALICGRGFFYGVCCAFAYPITYVEWLTIAAIGRCASCEVAIARIIVQHKPKCIGDTGDACVLYRGECVDGPYNIIRLARRMTDEEARNVLHVEGRSRITRFDDNYVSTYCYTSL